MSTPPKSVTRGSRPINISRIRKNKGQEERVEQAIDILNNIGMSRPEWGISNANTHKQNKTKALDTPMCSICVTDIGSSEGRYTTGCGHSFHLECVLPWFARSTYCPNCRRKDLKNPISLNKEN